MQRVINVFVFGPGILDKGVKKTVAEERADAPRWERILAEVKTKVMKDILSCFGAVFSTFPIPRLNTTSSFSVPPCAVPPVPITNRSFAVPSRPRLAPVPSAPQIDALNEDSKAHLQALQVQLVRALAPRRIIIR